MFLNRALLITPDYGKRTALATPPVLNLQILVFLLPDCHLARVLEDKILRQEWAFAQFYSSIEIPLVPG